MADTKISNLPAVAVPAGGDEFACNQAGVTKKETKTQITAATDAALAADVAALAAHVATTTAPIHGSSTAAGANTLVHRNAAGDVAATDFNAVAGTAANPSHTFTADPDTGLYRFAANELGIATVGAHRAHWNTTGALVVNDAAASTFMTGPGVTIQQGAFDDEAIALQSTDVAQPFTALADTDTYSIFRKSEPSSGGLALFGFKDADGLAGQAIALTGHLGENAHTDKTTAGRAIIEAYGYITNGGTGIGDTNADGNVFGIRTQRGGAVVTLLLVDEDADLHVLNDIVVAGLVDGVDVAAHAAATIAGTHGSSVAVGANLLVHRDAAGRAQITAPNVAADISNKAYVDAQTHIGGYGALITPAGITDRTRTLFVPAVSAYDNTAGSHIHDFNQDNGWVFPNNDFCLANGSFVVPNDFAAGLSVEAVIFGVTGNVYRQLSAWYGQCGENYHTHTNSTAYAAEAYANPQNGCIANLPLGAATAGDIVRLIFYRDAVNVLDTCEGYIYIIGFFVEYTADS